MGYVKMIEKMPENNDDSDEEIQDIEQQNSENKKFLEGLGE